MYISLLFYGLSDEKDDMPNYLVLSLQTNKIIPTPKKVTDEGLLARMEEKLLGVMDKFGLTRLELFRKIVVKCEDFIAFVRENSFGSDPANWPKICGDIFYNIPTFTPFGTCFTTKITVRLVNLFQSCLVQCHDE